MPTGFDPHVAAAFAAGAFDEVRRLLGPSAGGVTATTLFGRLIHTDMRARRLTARVADLESHRDEIDRTSTDRGLRWWLDGAVAERMLSGFDPSAGAFATRVLEGLKAETYPPLPVLYSRGRLHRVACLADLLAPDASRIASFREHRNEAVTDFLRCGFPEEVVVTRVFSAAFHTLVTGEEAFDNLARINSALAHRPDTGKGSVWTAPVELCRALVAFAAGDLAAGRVALDHVDRLTPLPVVVAVSTFGHLLASVVSAGAFDPTAVERALADLARRHPAIAEVASVQMAHSLLDRGRPEAARFVPVVGSSAHQAPGVIGAVDRRLLEIRVGILAGSRPPAGEINEHLDALAGIGRGRVAAGLALRIAADLERTTTNEVNDGVAADLDAGAVRDWAFDRLGSASPWTPWEQLWAAASGPNPAAASVPATDPAGDLGATGVDAAPVGVIHVLAPALEVLVDGRAVSVRDGPAKLLVAVVVAHPRPLEVDRAAELLWPGSDLGRVRARLNTVTHRLRGTLGPTGATLRRIDDVLVFDPGACEVDLFQYRAGCRGDADDRRWALRRVHGNLADAQFPYDELFIEARRSFVADWSRRAGELVAEQGVPRSELLDAASVLGLGPQDLG